MDGETGDTSEARRAIGAYLAGFGLDPTRHAPVVEIILTGVCADRRACSHESPSACAVLQAEQRFEAWLGLVLGAEIAAGPSAVPIGRAAFLACDGPTSWPDLVLVDDGLPENFVAAMRAAAPSLSPTPTPGAMAAQDLASWSVADLAHILGEALGGNLGWVASARLITASIKPNKPIP